jgi:hypothetical protein
MPSQRWRTFLRNHAWELITSGVAADLARRRQALSARIIPIVQRWWNRSVASRWRRTPQHDTTWRSWRSVPASGLAVWSPIIVEVTRVDQRSPPDCKPSYTLDPGVTTRAPSVDRFEVCPAGATLCGWNRTSLHARGAESLSKGRIRVAPWRRAA